MPETSVGGSLVKVLRMSGNATILLSTHAGDPRLTVVTPTGTASKSLAARGLTVRIHSPVCVFRSETL